MASLSPSNTAPMSTGVSSVESTADWVSDRAEAVGLGSFNSGGGGDVINASARAEDVRTKL